LHDEEESGIDSDCWTWGNLCNMTIIYVFN
jgi:hypothetical protein